jgi:hypothetical protein
MFETEAEQPVEDKKRANLIVGVLGLLALGLVVAVILVANSKPKVQPLLPNAVHAGAADFDNYKGKVELELIETIVHPNMIGLKQYQIKAQLTNRGERAITGVEVTGKMFGMEDQLITQGVSIPIPRTRSEPLKPGESMKFSVKLEPPAKVAESDIKHFTVELRGLQF